MASVTNLDNRRAFLRRLAGYAAPAALVGGGGAYGYGSVLERHRVVVERHDIKLSLGSRGPQRARVITLTDFHFDPLYEEDFFASCVEKVNALQPDVVLLTGDYISGTSRRIDDLAKILGGLQAKAGVFACLGNHDCWNGMSQIVNSLRTQGIGMLINQHTRLPCAGGELLLAGLTSVWGGHPNWAQASRGLHADERCVLMMHEPDFADRLREDARIALQCSGHTHGGQIRLPVYGALRLPAWGRKYQAGLYDVGKMKLHVNRGLGTIAVHVRFFCPPEIACFDLVNADLA